ncbi:Integrin beta-1-binding protein 2 [Manis javanica]|nr:Integrin beta-1-binding protein 2 [Manis javanica]
MSRLCHNKGCGQHFDPNTNHPDFCCHHPGVLIFHDALKVRVASKAASAKYIPSPGNGIGTEGIRPGTWSRFTKAPRVMVLHAPTTQEHFDSMRVGILDWGKQLPVSCQHDWYQTDSSVVVTVYGQIPLPALHWVKASQTELHVHIVFDGNCVFQAQMKLWWVINVEQSSVSLMPSRVEISLVKADPGSWAQLEHPDALAEKAKAGLGLEMDEEESEDSDDDVSWTEEEEEEEVMEE